MYVNVIQTLKPWTYSPGQVGNDIPWPTGKCFLYFQ